MMTPGIASVPKLGGEDHISGGAIHGKAISKNVFVT